MMKCHPRGHTLPPQEALWPLKLRQAAQRRACKEGSEAGVSAEAVF